MLRFARSMFGAYGAALDACSLHFVSRAGLDRGALAGLARRAVAVSNRRHIRKRDLVLNDALLVIDADTYEVRADGEEATGGREEFLRLAASDISCFDIALLPLFKSIEIVRDVFREEDPADSRLCLGETMTLGWGVSG